MTRRFVRVVSVFCGAVLTLVAAAPAQPVAKVVVKEAKEVTSPATITLVGSITPFRTSQVASKGAAKALEVPVRQGDSVDAGQILCHLDDETLTQSLREAEAALDARRARHEELLAGTRPQELRRLEALWKQAEADLERWRKEMERVNRLYSGQSSNEKEVYDTQANLAGAEAMAEAAKADYELGVEGPRKEVLAQAAYDVAEQEAVVKRLKNDLAKLTIRAPFAGSISKRFVEIGQWVDTGDPVVELIELGRVLARVDVPESALPYQHVGGDAKVLVEAVGKNFDGQTRYIVRQADLAARTFPVEIEIDNSEGVLASGMFVRATLPAGAPRDVVAVPKDAVVIRNGVASVAVVMPNPQASQEGQPALVAVTMPVTVGLDVDEWITITSGNIQPGMRVVVRGNETLLPFPQGVIIVDERGTPVAEKGGR
ncbi:MAG: efflux RND transporter periplasmic adaptor subunit [Phycisphaerae bacterium]|nr:efflux RND transporter periplasmic adaptor subunit [Phycisphaerae bacterium]